jgi:hypothetical protein
MKQFHPRSAGTLLAAALALAPGCGGASGTPDAAAPSYEQDEAISAELRATMLGLRERVLSALATGDAAGLRQLMAGDVLAELDRGPGFEATFSRLRQELQDAVFHPFHEFHADVPPGADRVEIVSDGEGLVIELAPRGAARYLTLLEWDDGFRDRLLALGWSREDGTWRLCQLRVGTWRLAGKTASQWYAEARTLYDRGLAYAAGKRLTVASDLLEPFPFLHVAEEQEFLALRDRVRDELVATYSFPIVLDGIDGEPRVYSIQPLFLDGELTQGVRYVTSSPLEAPALQPEVDRINAELARRIPGFCHETGNVAYLALSHPPGEEGRDAESVSLVASCEP